MASTCRLGPSRWGGEVEAQLLIRGEADELPLIGKRSPVAILQPIQDDAPRLADAQRMLQQFHQLRRRQPARQRADGGLEKGKRGKRGGPLRRESNRK